MNKKELINLYNEDETRFFQVVLDNYNVNAGTGDFLIDELDAWADYMRSDGYNFLDLCKRVDIEEDLNGYDGYTDDILIINNSLGYVNVLDSFENVEDFVDYLLDN